jgi:hypothetical protein
MKRETRCWWIWVVGFAGWVQWVGAATFTVWNVEDSGPGSLRQAILEANAEPGPDVIEFAIGTGPQTIRPLTELPGIVEAVVIEGTTQPGYEGRPLIELEGGAVMVEPGAEPALLRVDRASGVVIRGLVINDSALDGIQVLQSREVVVEGCYIGTDRSGMTSRSNGWAGVQILESEDCRIGGVGPGSGNVISGNADGIVAVESGGLVIQGNRIGTDADGLARVGNGACGIIMIHCGGGLIGGAVEGARNVISGNGRDGIQMMNARSAGNRVQGNYIGLDRTGTRALGNVRVGVLLSRDLRYGEGGASDNWIGGPGEGEGNVIAGNAVGGVRIVDVATTGNVVQGNRIGTDWTGTVALGNGTTGGVFIRDAPGNRVGGAGAGNVISGNQIGVTLSDAGARGNVVEGNWIGLQADGVTPLGNVSHGLVITNQASANVVGGVGPEAGNRIAANGGAGVFVWSGTNNTIRANSIYENAGLGIDLAPAGVTANDVGDTDTGPNLHQNFPVLEHAESDDERTVVVGVIESEAGREYRIGLYANPAPHASGHGEGRVFLGELSVATGAAGIGEFEAVLGVVMPGWTVAATATDAEGNTSEFSANVLVEAAPPRYLLTVVRGGDGLGSVTSEPGGIECGDTCTLLVPAGTVVTLSASPDPGSLFSGWAGDGEGGEARTVVMEGSATVLVFFDLEPIRDADLVVTVAADPNPAVAGGSVTVSFGVENAGPGEAADVVLTSVLPAGLEARSVRVSQGSWNEMDGELVYQVGHLGVGLSAGMVVEVTLVEAGVWTLSARVAGTTDDPVLSNNELSTGLIGVLPEVRISREPGSGGAEILLVIEVQDLSGYGVGIEYLDALPGDGAEWAVLEQDPEEAGRWRVAGVESRRFYRGVWVRQ